MENKRITFLENHKKDLQDGIWGLEFDIRHLERQKLTCKENELTDIVNGITMIKAKISSYKSRMETLDDVIEELKVEKKAK